MTPINNPFIPVPPPQGHPAAPHHAAMVSTMKKITADPGVSGVLNQVKAYNRKSPFGDFSVRDAIQSHPDFPKFKAHKDAYDRAMKNTPTSSAQGGHS